MSSTFWYFVGGAALGLMVPPVLLVLGLRTLLKRVAGKGERQLPPPPFPPLQPPAADFTLSFRYLDGEEAALEEWRGETVVLNFWATWCPGCVLELPNLAELARQGVEVLCISDEPVATLEAFVEKHPELKDLAVVSRTSQQLASVYKARGIPNTCILSPEGNIIFSHCGAADWSHASVLEFVRKLEGLPVAMAHESCSDGVCPLPQ